MNHCVRGGLLAGLASFVLVAGAWAQAGISRHMASFNEPLPQLLLHADDPATLREQLVAHARKVMDQDAEEASDAYALVGRSHQRAGNLREAIAAHERSLELFPSTKHRLALIDVLLQRREEADIAKAMHRIAEGLATRSVEDAGPVEYQARKAWAQFLSGHADSALAEFDRIERFVIKRPTWRYRVGRVQVAAGEMRRAYDVLLPLAVRSRGQDHEVMDLFKSIGEATGTTRNLDVEIGRRITENMRTELRVVLDLEAANLRFFARDSFPLGGVLITPPGDGPHRAAVVMVGPEDRYEDHDSLCVTLRDAGFAVMLVDVRGWGESVAPSCGLPDTWLGREEVLERLTARDPRAAFDELARRAPVESSRYLLVASRAVAPIAVQAAESDKRVAALLLISPSPEEVQRGPMRAGLARLRLPVYFQVGPEDHFVAPVTEEFYQVSDRGASLVVDGRSAGSGPTQFRHDPKMVARFIRWLGETFPAASGQSEAPRQAPRKG